MKLEGVSGEHIKVLGEEELPVHIGRPTYPLFFTMADMRDEATLGMPVPKDTGARDIQCHGRNESPLGPTVQVSRTSTVVV